MASYHQLIHDEAHQGHTFTVIPITRQNDHSCSTWMEEAQYRRLIQLGRRECAPPLTFENRVYRYQDKYMVWGSRHHQEYYQEKQRKSAIVDDDKSSLSGLVLISQRTPLEKEEFPLVIQYDEEYTEQIMIFKKGPMTLTLAKQVSTDQEPGYQARVTFRVDALREKYLEGHFNQLWCRIQEIW